MGVSKKRIDRKIMKSPAPNERFGASGAVTRLKFCADLQVLLPSEPLRNPARTPSPRPLPASHTVVSSQNTLTLISTKN